MPAHVIFYVKNFICFRMFRILTLMQTELRVCTCTYNVLVACEEIAVSCCQRAYRLRDGLHPWLQYCSMTVMWKYKSATLHFIAGRLILFPSPGLRKKKAKVQLGKPAGEMVFFLLAVLLACRLERKAPQMLRG